MLTVKVMSLDNLWIQHRRGVVIFGRAFRLLGLLSLLARRAILKRGYPCDFRHTIFLPLSYNRSKRRTGNNEAECVGEYLGNSELTIASRS